MGMHALSLFAISKNEGRWPNRHYVELDQTVLWKDGTKEEYVDWLYAQLETENDVSAAMAELIEAVSEGYQVRLLVPDRHKGHIHVVIVDLVYQILKDQPTKEPK